ncbi:MAG: hypothetical protein R3C58_16365, partial [Parvularculaceae bacterium]
MVDFLQQTGVAIGIETIALVDGVGVGAFHAFGAGKGANQHKKGRARQVEIGHHRVDDLKAITGRDEDRCFPGEGTNRARLIRRAFKQTKACRADGDNAPTPRLCRINSRRLLRGDLAPLGVH